jgi:dTDP-4-amino-4,6-dideoxygalactose transaminase
VANGTDALILALKALGIGPGDEVITVPFTFIASAASVAQVGAQVKFVDIDPKSYTIDVTLLEKAITPKTKAIIAVHLFGQPANMDPIMALARRHNIKVIEDAAQAHGAEYNLKRVGTLGDIATFSFYPTKNLGGAGDGGAVVSSSAELIEKVTQLANHGRKTAYFHEIEGVNSRLDAIQAAYLRVQLEGLDKANERRRDVAARYMAALRENAFITAPTIEPYAKHVFHLYCVETSHREELMRYLTEKQIGHGVYYPLPLHLMPAYARLKQGKGSFPVSERLSERILSLPMYPNLTDAQVDYVCAALKGFSPKVAAGKTQ